MALTFLEALPLIGLLFVIAALLFALTHTRSNAEPEATRDATTSEAMADAQATRTAMADLPAGVERRVDGVDGVRRRRGGLARMRRAAAATPALTSGSDGEEGDVEAVSKRDRRKEERRAAKRTAQSARAADLAARLERDEEADAARREADALEADAEAVAEETAARQEEERRRREEEEYADWKHMISVEEYGHGGIDDGLEEPDRLARFCDTVRTGKVVVLEDLAAEFGLATDVVVDRLQRLQEAGTLDGFFDDRGKFVYVSREEMLHVAQLIRRRGRISIHELAVETSAILRLDADASDTPAAVQL